MLQKEIYLNGGGGNISNAKIHFIASKDFTNVNFFQNIDHKNSYDFSYLQVYINDTLTEQEANSISANANDDIKIISTTNKYPRFGRYSSNESTYDIDYIKSIEEPLPLMVDAYDTPISKLNNCFFNCASLVSIPEGLFDNNPEVTDFSSCFGYCSALTSIPAGLFDNNPNVTNFRFCFHSCSALTSIPQGLFDNNPNVTSFSSCFNSCSALTSIPVGLFNNNPNVTYFDNCFYACTSLTSIPEGLFDNNTNVTEFNQCFGYCTALTSIPIGLFDNNLNVTDFAYCFLNCSALTSIPLGLFDNNTNVNEFRMCFADCRNLTVNVQIGSTTTEYVNVYEFANNTAAKGTVYCRAGSEAYNAFLKSTDANVNVLTY